MSRELKYIGMEVYKEAIVIAVLDGSGKLVMETILETKASSILQFIHGLAYCPPLTTASSLSMASAIAISAPSSSPRLPTTNNRPAATLPGLAANFACCGLTLCSPKSWAHTATNSLPPAARSS